MRKEIVSRREKELAISKIKAELSTRERKKLRMVDNRFGDQVDSKADVEDIIEIVRGAQGLINVSIARERDEHGTKCQSVTYWNNMEFKDVLDLFARTINTVDEHLREMAVKFNNQVEKDANIDDEEVKESGVQVIYFHLWSELMTRYFRWWDEERKDLPMKGVLPIPILLYKGKERADELPSWLRYALSGNDLRGLVDMDREKLKRDFNMEVF